MDRSVCCGFEIFSGWDKSTTEIHHSHICASQFCSFKQGTSGEGSSNAFITLNFFVSSLNLFSAVHTQENFTRMIIICRIKKSLKSAKAVGQWKTDCLTVSYESMATLAFVTNRIAEFHLDFVQCIFLNQY